MVTFSLSVPDDTNIISWNSVLAQVLAISMSYSMQLLKAGTFPIILIHWYSTHKLWQFQCLHLHTHHSIYTLASSTTDWVSDEVAMPSVFRTRFSISHLAVPIHINGSHQPCNVQEWKPYVKVKGLRYVRRLWLQAVLMLCSFYRQYCCTKRLN